MGLDQYIYAETDSDKDLELAYWRKHPNLHGWMLKHLKAKEDSNCENLYLSVEDIDAAINAVQNFDLPETSGFFFGKSYMDNEERNYTLENLNKVKKYFLDNPKAKVYYFAWW